MIMDSRSIPSYKAFSNTSLKLQVSNINKTKPRKAKSIQYKVAIGKILQIIHLNSKVIPVKALKDLAINHLRIKEYHAKLLMHLPKKFLS